MAESCAPLLDGGYEAEFAESVPDSLSCSICLLPFRNPHLVSCCGAKFCEICINRVKTAGQPCPLCKQEFVSLIDRSFQRKVLELNVRCSRNKDGCQWVGELRHLVQHEKEECVWVVIECSYQCGAHLPRKLMAEHEQEKCPQRPTDVKIDKFIKRIEERHTREMRIMEKKIAEQDQKIKEMADVLERIKKLEEEVIPRMKCLLTSSHPVPSFIEFTMARYSAFKKARGGWYSPSFYTGPGGYKMCIAVSAYGTGKGAGSYVTMLVHLMRGEYDNRLIWPFRGDITVQLVNHRNDQDRCEMTVPFNDAAVAGNVSDRVTSELRATKGLGNTKFISHSTVEYPTETRQYIINDSLTWRVTKTIVYSV